MCSIHIIINNNNNKIKIKMEEIKQLNKFEKNRLNEQNIQQEDESKKS